MLFVSLGVILFDTVTLLTPKSRRYYLNVQVLFIFTFFVSFWQMILYLAEAHQHFGCTEIFKEPSKFALSDYYEDHYVVPYQRIVLVTNKRVMLLQVSQVVLQ